MASQFYAYANDICGYSGQVIRASRDITLDDGETATINGTDVYYLVGLEGPDGRPTPATQLDAIQKESKEDGIVTVHEMVGTGFTPIKGTGTQRRVNTPRGWRTVTDKPEWTLRNIVARRTYAFPLTATTEERDTIKRTTPYLDGLGREVKVWCRLVRVDVAREAGFNIPRNHLGNNRRPGTRNVGREDGSVPIGQRKVASAVTRTATVEVGAGDQNISNGANVEWRE